MKFLVLIMTVAFSVHSFASEGFETPEQAIESLSAGGGEGRCVTTDVNENYCVISHAGYLQSGFVVKMNDQRWYVIESSVKSGKSFLENN